MSFIVKGYECPSDCYNCPFSYGDWYDDTILHCELQDEKHGCNSNETVRPSYCSIKEIDENYKKTSVYRMTIKTLEQKLAFYKNHYEEVKALKQELRRYKEKYGNLY